jgi:hypothetical protein
MPREGTSGLVAGSDTTAHQGASRLLAPEGLGSLISKRRDAELCQYLRTPDQANPAFAAVHGQAAQVRDRIA